MPGKRALVTGASGGLGLHFAQLLAQAGYDLVLVARTQSKLEALAGELRAKHGIAAEPIGCDLAKPGAASEIVARVPECDVLVNNAGFGNNGPFAEIDERKMFEELQLDIVALTQLTRAYLPGMLRRGSGKILNVASTAAFLPGPNMAVYYASKAYVLSLSEALAYETRGTGVTVTCLCPGATATDFHARTGVVEGETLLTRLPMADPLKVAKAGIDGMMRGTAVVIPGVSNKFVAASGRLMPRALTIPISAKAVAKR